MYNPVGTIINHFHHVSSERLHVFLQVYHFAADAVCNYGTRSIWKMLGPFATASRPHAAVFHCHSPGVATVARRLRYSYSYRCPQQQQQQRQGVTEGTAMGPIRLEINGRTHERTLPVALSFRLAWSIIITGTRITPTRHSLCFVKQSP